jgi:hypothetical protein
MPKGSLFLGNIFLSYFDPLFNLSKIIRSHIPPMHHATTRNAEMRLPVQHSPTVQYKVSAPAARKKF